MRRKVLLVLILLQVGCSLGGEQAANEANKLQAPGAGSLPEVTARPTQAAAEPQAQPTLANLGSAPELTNEVWLNSAGPLRLADLRGRVVLLEMWTFG